MQKKLKKPARNAGRMEFYVNGGTNETCTNGSCGGSSTPSTPGAGCKAMGGNTVCHP